jgi:hypothetical protein
MKTSIYSTCRMLSRYFFLGLILSVLAACEKETIVPINENDLKTEISENADRSHNSKKVIIRSEGMNFIAPEEIKSGWNTFRYENGTGHPHFFVIEKLPEGKTIEDSKAEVVPIFQQGMDLIAEDKFDEAMEVFFSLPDWYWEVVLQGGPGLVSPGMAAESMVYMTPGDYVIECYIKTPNGVFHSSIGMAEGIHVLEESTKIKEPKPTLKINISSTSGIEISGKVRPGHHEISVYYEDQSVYGNFVGHDVHLVKLSPGADIDALNGWMNWTTPGQFETPAPQGFSFMGGMQELPAGGTGYFSAKLTPGTYALISEVPDPASKNMFKIFEVPQH